MAEVIVFKPKRLPPVTHPPLDHLPIHEQADVAAALATGFRSMSEARDFALAMGILDSLENFARETLEMVEVFRKTGQKSGQT